MEIASYLLACNSVVRYPPGPSPGLAFFLSRLSNVEFIHTIYPYSPCKFSFNDVKKNPIARSPPV